jgi:hypothetical protein
MSGRCRLGRRRIPWSPTSTSPFSARTRRALSGPQSRLGLCEFKPTEDVGLSLRVITAPACDRFARFAFEYAATANIDRLAVIHKRTALPQTEGLFIGAFEKLHPEYPNIELELVRIDTFSSSFPRDPTGTGSPPLPISLATSCPTRPPGSPAVSASPRH